MIDHWNVLYQVSVFYADRKSKMTATTGHRLTCWPSDFGEELEMGKVYRRQTMDAK
jgi:hypothetical protein